MKFPIKMFRQREKYTDWQPHPQSIFLLWEGSNKQKIALGTRLPDWDTLQYGTIHICRPWKLPNFQVGGPTCPGTSKILPPHWPWMFNFSQTPSPLQMITNQLEGNIILGWLLYVINSFLQVGFHFQYRLINLVWLSIDFFSFSWSQSHPQNNFKKLKTYFSPCSYSEKMRSSQDWAEASLCTFSWHYIFVCAVVQKYREMFSLKKFFLVLILQSTCFICITSKRKQTTEQQPHQLALNFSLLHFLVCICVYTYF